MSNKPRKQIGDYELLELLAGGGEASVYKARHTVTEEIVAVKLSHVRGEDEDADRRFHRETDILQRISHRNIVQYRDSFILDDEWGEPQRCMVMELLEGETLKQRLLKYPRGIPWKEAKYTLQQCLEGLIYVRDELGLTHRDIKPSNIFVLRDGTAKLLDFGIARIEEDATVATGNTEWLGSFDFMAPEFAGQNQEPGDEVSDIFSLTVCFYQAVTGRLPYPKFSEHPELEYFERWSSSRDMTPSHAPITFRVVKGLTGFIDKGLKVERDERFQNYEDTLAALQKLQARTIRHDATGDYELQEGLGKGGFGEVYKARRLADDKLVAIKRLFSDRESDRFLKEAEILRTYRHPHLVDYIDSFHVDAGGSGQSLFLVLEYLNGMPGLSLGDRIKKSPTGIHPIEVLKIFGHCLSALGYLHAHGIIHRDIKPGNIYAPTGTPDKSKILDLGIARDTEGTNTQGVVPGTWDYMAPEFVVDNARGSPQSDIYALGLTFYEALTGKPAFPRITGSGQKAITQFVARATGAQKIDIDFSMPVFEKFPALAGIIKQATHRELEGRFPSCTDMQASVLSILQVAGESLSEFEDTQRGLPPVEKMAAASERPSRKRGARSVGIGLALGAVAVLTAWMGYRYIADRSTPRPSPLPDLGGPVAPTSSPGTVVTSPEQTVTQKAEQDRLAEQQRRLAEKQKKLEEEIKKLEAEKRLDSQKPNVVNLPPANSIQNKQVDNAVQTMAMQSAMGLDRSSYDACLRDIDRRVRMVTHTLQRQDDRNKQHPDVLSERRNFWRFVAREAIDVYQSDPTQHHRYLAIARGAIVAALPLYGQDAPTVSRLIRTWDKALKNTNIAVLLPVPSGRILTAEPTPSAYLAGSRPTRLQSTVILPHALSLSIHALSGNRKIHQTMRLCLVPEGTGTPGSLHVPQPFYMASTETTLGLMRVYRAGVRHDLMKDPALTQMFGTKLNPLPPAPGTVPYARAQIHEALEFCNWLSYRQGLPLVYKRGANGQWVADLSRHGFRLPTQTEWEYAARYGFDWNAVGKALTWPRLAEQWKKEHTDKRVWFYYKKEPRTILSQPVETYPLGFRDMCGNVGELCMVRSSLNASVQQKVQLVVCGGSFKSKSTKEVMPGYSREYGAHQDSIGFRVMLPMPIEKLDK